MREAVQLGTQGLKRVQRHEHFAKNKLTANI